MSMNVWVVISLCRYDTSSYVLYTPTLGLTAAAPHGAVPIRHVVVEGAMDLAEWLKQANLLGGDVGWECRHLEVSITQHEVRCVLHTASLSSACVCACVYV